MICCSGNAWAWRKVEKSREVEVQDGRKTAVGLTFFTAFVMLVKKQNAGCRAVKALRVGE